MLYQKYIKNPSLLHDAEVISIRNNPLENYVEIEMDVFESVEPPKSESNTVLTLKFDRVFEVLYSKKPWDLMNSDEDNTGGWEEYLTHSFDFTLLNFEIQDSKYNSFSEKHMNCSARKVQLIFSNGLRMEIDFVDFSFVKGDAYVLKQ